MSDINHDIAPRNVKIKNISSASLKNLNKSIADIKSKMSIMRKSKNSILKKIKYLNSSNKKIKGLRKIKNIAAGNNACFSRRTNEVLINLDKFGCAVFHEIGHSINYNANNF